MIDQTQQTSPSPGTVAGLQVTLQPARAYRHVDTIVLTAGRYAVGAAEDADVVLPVGGVQRQHCRIEVVENVVNVTADSRMTWINDEPVDSRDLCDGDRLAIGPVEFLVRVSRATQGPSTQNHVCELQSDDINELCSSAGVGQHHSAEGHGNPPGATSQTAAQLADARQLLASHEAKLAQTEQAVAELEARRSNLQSVVDKLLESASVEQHRRDELELEDRRRREQLARLENDASLWRASLAERAQDVDQLRIDLERRFAALQEIEVQIEARSNELEHAAEVLAVQKREQSEREALLQARIDDVDQSEAAFNEREAELLQRAEELDQERRSMEGSRDQSAQGVQEMTDRSDELHQRTMELQQRLVTIKAWRSALKQQAAAMATQQNHAERRDNELSDFETALQNRESELDARQQQLEERDASLSELQQNVTTRDVDVQTAWAEIAESRAQLDRQREEFGAKYETLARDRRTLREDQEAMDVLRRNLQERQRELEDERRRCRDQLAHADAAEERQEADLRGFAATQEEWQRERQAFEEQIHALQAELNDVHGQCDSGRSVVDTVPDGDEADADEADQFAIDNDQGQCPDDEVVDEEVPSQIRELRSHMASVFGYDASDAAGSDVAAETAAPVETPDDVAVDAEDIDSAAGSVPSTDADEEDSDSVTGYMQRLYALYRGTDDSGSEPAAENADAVESDETACDESPADEVDVPLTDIARDSVADEPAAVADDAIAARQQAKRDADLERQKLNSLREVANLSARSDLARHASTELKSALLAEGLVTGLCVTGTIVLLASPLWSELSLVHWGVVSAVVSVLMTWRTLKTTARMQSHRSAGKSTKNGQQEAGSPEQDPAEVASTTTQEEGPDSVAAEEHETVEVN